LSSTSDPFDELADAYARAVVWSHLPAAERLAAADEFRAKARRLAERPEEALAIALRELGSDDDDRANAAARLLAELPLEAAAAALATAHAEPTGSRLDRAQVGLLGRVAPAPALTVLANADDPYLRQHALRALVRRPGPEAKRLLEDADDALAPALVRSAAHWAEDALLESLLDRGGATAAAAATELGARCRTSGVAYLGKRADAQACLALAQLGHPEGLAPTARLLRTAPGDDRDLARTAAQYLRAAALGPALLDLLAQPALAADAAAVLYELTGVPYEEDFDAAGRLTEAALADAREKQRAALSRLDPTRRYYLGEPLALSTLAELLTSPHTGTATAAGYGLRAATCEDFGFDPDDDLIANADAVRAWQRRASDPGPLTPGGWWFAGAELPAP
jgi:hypothetical protein